MIIDCPICGKLTCIHWPQFWPYRRAETYYCSWTCMDVSLCRDMNMIKEAEKRKRSKKNMKTIVTKEQKQKAVSMAIDGYDPLEYLREIGSKSPDKMWYFIKKSVKESDPELYAKIPDLRKIEKVDQKPEEVPVVKVDGAIRIETPEAGMITVNGKVPGSDAIPNIEYKVTGIDTAVGSFIYSKKHGYVDWDPMDGNGLVSMNLEEWKEFMKVFPEAMKVLGVEL